MFIKHWVLTVPILAALSISGTAHAHGDQTVFHALRLDLDAGENSESDPVANWDLDGWVGGDTNRVWLKSEGEVTDGSTEQSENWVMYSRNIATFWDAQAGIRYDNQPESTTYFVAGFTGLAPYYFETEAHVFASDDGDVSFRLREELDLLFTQQFILQPHLELNAFAQDVPKLEVGSGLSDAQLGLQFRHEITRKFAPYIEYRVSRKFGETADLADQRGDSRSDSMITLGVRLMF